MKKTTLLFSFLFFSLTSSAIEPINSGYKIVATLKDLSSLSRALGAAHAIVEICGDNTHVDIEGPLYSSNYLQQLMNKEQLDFFNQKFSKSKQEMIEKTNKRPPTKEECMAGSISIYKDLERPILRLYSKVRPK